MVSVDVGNEHGFNLQKAQMGPSYLLLGAFGAVDKKQAPVYTEHLGAWISIRNGHSRSCAHCRQSKIHKELFSLCKLLLECCKSVDVAESCLLDICIYLLYSLLGVLYLCCCGLLLDLGISAEV